MTLKEIIENAIRPIDISSFEDEVLYEECETCNAEGCEDCNYLGWIEHEC